MDPLILLTSLDVWHDNMFSSSTVAMFCIVALKIQSFGLELVGRLGSWGPLSHRKD
jgi:hypothetical protein